MSCSTSGRWCDKQSGRRENEPTRMAGGISVEAKIHRHLLLWPSTLTLLATVG